MHVLVSGAAGFVGRWLTTAFRKAGIEVTALATAPLPTDASNTRSGDVSPGDHTLASIHWRYGDLRDGDYVRAAVDAAPFDYVVHLAAISHVPTAEADPALTWDVNVTATARLLHQLDRRRAAGEIDPTVLIVGSAEQYGRHDAEQLPLTENSTQWPRSIYAATKAAQEVLALQRWRAAGLKVVVARSFNHSGPGQEPRFVIPALIARALALRAAPAGTPLSLGNVTPVRDFLHVSDVVAAYIALCQRGEPGEAYNVCSGTGRSVQEIVNIVLERTGVQPPLVVDPALVRTVDVPALVGDPVKLHRATGWRPTRTFEDIIDDLIHATTF